MTRKKKKKTYTPHLAQLSLFCLAFLESDSSIHLPLDQFKNIHNVLLQAILKEKQNKQPCTFHCMATWMYKDTPKSKYRCMKITCLQIHEMLITSVYIQSILLTNSQKLLLKKKEN